MEVDPPITPPQIATADALRSVAMFEQLKVPIIGLVENMAGDFFGSGGGEQLARERNLTFLGRVPLQADVREGGDYGRPVVAHNPDSAAGQAFMQIARNAAARTSVLMMQNSDVIPINIIN